MTTRHLVAALLGINIVLLLAIGAHQSANTPYWVSVPVASIAVTTLWLSGRSGGRSLVHHDRNRIVDSPISTPESDNGLSGVAVVTGPCESAIDQ